MVGNIGFTLNANDLVWTALVIGGVLFTTWLMRG
jgi:hypothetical protein